MTTATRSQLSAVPRWQTTRDPSCPTLGPAVAGVADALGRPLLPWQRRFANTVGEVLPSGRMRYPVVIAIVPRRAGKSVLMLATLLQRAAMGSGRRCWYTAQTGADAGRTLRDEWLPLLPPELRRVIRPRLSNGGEAITMPSRNAHIGVFPPTRVGLHGKDADVIVVDEAWSHSADAGAELDAAMGPAQATRRQRQRFIISAGGDADSTWLLALRQLGRETVDAGRCAEAGLAFIEYSADAERDDLDDPATWQRTHPAIGHTIDLDAVRHDHATLDRDAFVRGYLSVFTAASSATVIPAEAWQACRDPGAAVVAPVHVGYAVGIDGRHAAIVVATRAGDDGALTVELAKYGTGTSWVAEHAARLRREHAAPLVAPATGPATVVTGQLARAGVDVTELPATDYARACQAFLDDVHNGRLRHRGQPALDVAARGAARAERGEGWIWTVKRSAVDVSPIVAATVAAQSARTRAGSAPIMRLAAS